MSSVKKASICALCIALCNVLPMAFHFIGLGHQFSPMHIPVFICGLACGAPYGLLCGLAGPAISTLISNMPTAADLPRMLAELAVYGVVSGMMMRVLRTKSTYLDLYLSLAVALVLGRIAAGVATALLFYKGNYTPALWASSYVVKTLPGTIVQFVFVPSIIFALIKARLLPPRYKS
ncbi:MAG: ECF transporter S component [Oscillospiraceae bacterium]|jgi:uncharacterized membrane protein|nr:ECF transporter S component [Oscillospiraceae bacterium]